MCPPPKPQRPYHRQTLSALSLHSVFAWLFSTALICLTHKTTQHHSSLTSCSCNTPLSWLPTTPSTGPLARSNVCTYHLAKNTKTSAIPYHQILQGRGKGEKQEIAKVDPIACCTAEPFIELSRRQSPRSVAPARARFLAISRHLSPRREQGLCATLQGGLRIEHSLQSCGWSASLQPLTNVISSTNV